MSQYQIIKPANDNIRSHRHADERKAELLLPIVELIAAQAVQDAANAAANDNGKEEKEEKEEEEKRGGREGREGERFRS